MTRRPDTIGLRSLELRKVSGKREKSGYNVAEAEAVITEINRIARAEAKRTPADKSSIGVLSPYRDQVNYLSRTLASRLKSRILQDHDITVGTAHTFQGDERDVMLLSFCADPTSHRSTVTFLNNENLFNVAVTRARRRQVIYTALDPRHLPIDHLLREYLTYAADCAEVDQPESLADGRRDSTAFERAVADELAQHPGYTVYLGYPVAGFSIDVVAACGRQALAIACDGDPQRLTSPSDTLSLDSIAGQTILERAGWRVHRVPYRRWLLDQESCLEEIDGLLGGAGADDGEE
jgi:hypothetical protein